MLTSYSAEMASMAPTSGGQYHWVSEFAPPSLQKPLSYVVGWCCCLGWIAGVPSCCVQLAGMVTTVSHLARAGRCDTEHLQMVLLVHPNADVNQLWQATLLLFCFIVMAAAFNIFFAQHLPLAEGIILFAHIFGFFVFLLAFWILGEHGKHLHDDMPSCRTCLIAHLTKTVAPASRVFAEFQ